MRAGVPRVLHRFSAAFTVFKMTNVCANVHPMRPMRVSQCMTEGGAQCVPNACPMRAQCGLSCVGVVGWAHQSTGVASAQLTEHVVIWPSSADPGRPSDCGEGGCLRVLRGGNGRHNSSWDHAPSPVRAGRHELGLVALGERPCWSRALGVGAEGRAHLQDKRAAPSVLATAPAVLSEIRQQASPPPPHCICTP